MIAQQNNVDTIANNLANVNTNGYKTEVAEFKSLLYQDINAKSTSANSEQKPIPSQVGLGVRNSAITSIFTQGAFFDSTNDLAFAINGDGFFGVKGQDGNTYYTRNGNFVLATDTNGLALTTTDGLKVLDADGNPIVLDKNYDKDELLQAINIANEFDISLIIQPMDCKDKFNTLDKNSLIELFDFVTKNATNARLIPQSHKFLGLL